MRRIAMGLCALALLCSMLAVPVMAAPSVAPIAEKDSTVTIGAGRFGPYIKYGDRNISLPRGTDPLKVDLDTCIQLISESQNKKTGGIIAEFKDSDIQVIDGSYGPYIKHAGSNYKIPKGTDASSLTEDKCKEIISTSEPTGRKKRRK